MTQLLTAKPLVATIEEELKQHVATLATRAIQPKLAVILVGDDPASAIYVKRKQQACERVGIVSVSRILPASASEQQVLQVVAELNQDSSVHGILCQSPLPKGIDEELIFQTVHHGKDVDCFHPFNVGLLTLGTPRFMPCTPYGVIQLLTRNQIATAGKRVVVLGRSNIVGRPLSILLSLKQYNATVQICHSATTELAKRCRDADILIAAIGKPEFVTEEYVKDNAVVIDVGINRIDGAGKTSIVGDVAFQSVQNKASAITPVPGGVGPMTICMLMYNCINAAALANDLPTFTL